LRMRAIGCARPLADAHAGTQADDPANLPFLLRLGRLAKDAQAENKDPQQDQNKSF
jgi:hypothetical protein